VQAGPRPARTVEEDPTAERLHPVLEASQAGAAAEVGAPGTVVADLEEQNIADDLDLDADSRGAGVLGSVGQRLGDDVVGADFYRLRQPLSHMHLQVDEDR